jgi:photosystem II stability/assembly factor-like uncharacterized protein
MTRYERVLQILDEAIGGPGANIGVHGAFWRGLTRDQFAAKKVVGRPLLVVGDGAASNLVRALKGEAPFGADLPNPPPGAQLSRMPAGLDPVSDGNIAFIQKWIDDGCPEDPFVAATLRWRPTNAPEASSRTDDIWFLNPDVGWAVNSNGQVLQTQDGGARWAEQFHDEEVYFRCVGFADAAHGWVGTLTANKRLFQTQDGGAHWEPVSLPPLAPSAVCGLSVVNAAVVYASGTNYPNRPARMVKTTDGGATWAARDMTPHASCLIDTLFISPERGWVVGGKSDAPVPNRGNVRAVVLWTEDGGRTWVDRLAGIRDQLPLGEWGWKIQRLNDQVLFVSLENFSAGAILKSTDGGRTWQRLPVNDPQHNTNLEGIGFVDESHGWVGGWGSADFSAGFSSETLDGGRTWRDANEIGRFLNRFRFFGSPVTVGYASGRTVFKYSADPVPPPHPAVAAAGPRFLDSAEPADAAGVVQFPVTVPAGARRLTVRVWDRFGEQVRTLVDEPDPPPGRRAVPWDRTDDAGRPLAPGGFIWRVTVDGNSESRIVTVR